MNAPIASKKLLRTAKTTTVFTSGNSQAVRLPKEFRLNTKTVEISRRGDEIVLREHRPTLAEVLADLPALTPAEVALWDDAMTSLRSDSLPLEDRDFSWMSNPSRDLADKKSKVTPRPPRAKSPRKARG